MNDAPPALPHLRWGILGTGWISSMFVTDLLAPRPSALATHIITAIGSSSIQKGNAFVSKLFTSPSRSQPKVYDSYDGVYADPNVDIVYIGTPHSVHKENCLAAIAAGKHVLCEKPFTITASETEDVITAARAKGVFVMEAMWIRFNPLFSALSEELWAKKSIGDVTRVMIDFGNKMPLDTLPAESRLKDPKLGAGALLDIGVYTLTYASFILGDGKVGREHPQPRKVTGSLSIVDGIDESNVVVLNYAPKEGEKRGKTAVCSSTFHYKGGEDFARLEGTDGEIVIFGVAASVPGGFRVKGGPQPGHGEKDERVERTYKVERPEGTLGFCWEADAVAVDIAKGRKENERMPLDETLRMMKLMDEIRKKGDLRYPQDEW
jgi:dihydrodiol dehydrogenase / D-xylose 1-dehydrogenase (NADP)